MRAFFANTMIFRIIFILVGVLLLMFFCIVRVADLSVGAYAEADLNSNGYTVEVDEGRGEIYDSYGEKLTGEKSVYYLIFAPCDEAILKFAQVTSGVEREVGLERLRDKKPTIIKSDKNISGVGVYSYKSNDRYSLNLGLEHIIGYINDSGDGVTGVEKAYNNILKASGNTELYFETTASGEFLLGAKPSIKRQYSKGDLYLTIDKEIQSVCNSAAKNIKKGAIVVVENQTGKIRGMVSKPGFDVHNLMQSVNDENSPFINRALNAYSVGSVFKPLVAAGMLETSKEDYKFECVGYSDILGIRFYCNNRNGHGKMDLNGALVNSCNTYFYNAAALGKPAIFTNLSSVLGFGRRIKIADEMYTARGNITSLKDLEKSKANIANFAIGQGDITLSPLALSNLYSAIANEGYYFSPYLVEGYTENGKYYKTKKSAKTVAFSQNVALKLKQYLINTVNIGTGKKAKPKSFGAGGKTATAQTGRFNDNNREILNAWFCGFFPEQEPKYVAVVLLEEASSGGSDSAPVFKKIAEDIMALK